VFSNSCLKAQVDPHFSQFYAYPLWLNPGMAGVMNGDVRVTSVYRSQWSNVMTPFTTMGLSADVATNKNLNVGLSFMNQLAGDAGYKYTTASASIAYSGVRFGKDKNHQITAAMQFGMISRRFDPSKFQYGDQWNAVTGYDPSVISSDIVSTTSSAVLDVSAGFSYFDASPDKKINLFAGGGVFHINQPYDPFIDNSRFKDYIAARYTAHFGGRITLTDRVSITPNFLYLQQGNSREMMAGLFSTYSVNEETDLYVGVNYRIKDAISPYIGVGFRHFVAGISYDSNISDLGKAAPGTSSFEVSISYMRPKSGKSLRYLSCPKF
jgi:type IX secretion system PorP/SprF family membrane protein